ncbi:DnaJ C-terminal domain-containing protein [Sphingomonas solaris]|uniref:J domain-containing protein n=1 Tax=Alterirhizorhabdus solaris TaxID=2529389 RepID=A0A558R4S7_9SPHN|nr:DnaJ C-terminal domain-containing protein [Sphingomonas solaris]TVV74385.1 J domain-containing protein [Sphingomonas solaris]
MADIYSKLGVERGADEATIKKAYRKLAKELHPDRNQDNPKAAERFSDVTAAYDLLTDKDKRARYDRGEIDEQGNPKAPFGFGGGGGGFRPNGGRAGQPGFEFGGEGGEFGDIFEGIFGGGRGGRGGGFNAGFGGGGARRPAPKGANVAYRLSVPFEEAAALKPQRVTLSDGKTIDIKLPAGVEDGTQMRLSGKGEAGAGGAGDAILTIEIRPHRFFTRDGDDVRLDLPIGLDEAVKGAAVTTPTVEGAVKLSVPKGATSGKTLRLKGRGFHRKDGGRGDQLVTLAIDIPADDAALQAFVEEWEGAATRNPRAGLGV